MLSAELEAYLAKRIRELPTLTLELSDVQEALCRLGPRVCLQPRNNMPESVDTLCLHDIIVRTLTDDNHQPFLACPYHGPLPFEYTAASPDPISGVVWI